MSSVDASATDTPLPLTIGKTSTITDLNHNSQTIELQHSYNDPVVFAQPFPTMAAIPPPFALKISKATASLPRSKNQTTKMAGTQKKALITLSLKQEPGS